MSVASVFLVHSAVSGTLAPRIPAIKSHLDLDDGRLGVALTGFAVGLFVGTRVAAWLIDRFGSGRLIRAGLPVMAAVLVAPALAGGLAALTISLLLLGTIAGLLDVTMNAQAVAVERAYMRPIMSAFHGIWSVGLLASAALASGAAAAGVGVRVHFGVAAGLLATAAAFVPRGLLAPDEEHPSIHEADPRRPFGRALSAGVLALGLIGFSSFFGEGAAADWSAVYLRDDIGTSGGVAGLAFTAFGLGMVVARFTADRLNARFGPVALVRAGGTVAALGLALALLIPHHATALAGFLVFGLGLAPIVPLVFSAAGNVGGPSAAALGWVVTASYVGSVLGPAAIGYVANAVGLRVGLVLPAVLGVLIAALAPFARSAAGGTEWPHTVI
jgi:MFS family permease